MFISELVMIIIKVVSFISIAGFVACSATNPIWFVKTRLQLDYASGGKKLTAAQCIKRIYIQSVSRIVSDNSVD
jgi:hypothetical protein